MAEERASTFAFPDLSSLQVREVVTSGDRKVRLFWDRLVAFYAYVRDQVGASDYPHPSGVRVHPDDDERLRAWCSEPLKSRSKRSRDLKTGMAWFDKGPAIDEEVDLGEITVLLDRAYPEGMPRV